MLWNIPSIWNGGTAAILAGGPSMSQDVADSLRGMCHVVAVNDQYRLAPWADVLYAADWQWWKHHEDAVKFKGWKISIGNSFMPAAPGINYVGNGGEFGFDDRPSHVRTCKNSGYQAMHVAAHFGAKRILLFGFDMKLVDEQEHWFGSHPQTLRRDIPFKAFISLMSQSAPEFKRRGIEVVNCTPNSALKGYCLADPDVILSKLSVEKNNAGLCVDTRAAAVPSQCVL